MAKNLKILFVARAADNFHNFKSVIEALVSRGHFVRFISDPAWDDKEAASKNLDAFQAANKGFFEYGRAVRRDDWWRKILFHTRELLSYRSYLLPPRKDYRMFYRDRWKGYLPAALQSFFDYNLARFILKNNLVAMALRAFESVAPADRKISGDILKFKPDAVVTSPVNARFSSADLEYLKAAKAMKIPTALPVISWDNLTNKGLIHIVPDVLLVWSEEGKKEAILHHRIPERRIRITGAPVFDQWFLKMKVSQTKDGFCAKYKLRAEDPIVLYLGSSANIARDESWVLEQLRDGLDGDGALKNVQIIIRPHPANFRIYEKLKLKDILVLPKEGRVPNSEDSLKLFYDTLSYSLCTIGINTSGMIDTIIAGKPGMAFMPDEYKDSQLETLHFRHLFSSGALYGVKNAEEFTTALKKLLNGEDTRKKKREAFVEKFIRTNGLEIPAGEVAATEIEMLAETALI